MYDSVEPEPKKEFMSKLHEISFYCKHFLSNLILKIRFRILVYNILVYSIHIIHVKLQSRVIFRHYPYGKI